MSKAYPAICYSSAYLVRLETFTEKTEELERKRRSLDSFEDKKEKKKKLRESTSNKRNAEKERRDNHKQLRAESQRLLRGAVVVDGDSECACLGASVTDKVEKAELEETLIALQPPRTI